MALWTYADWVTYPTGSDRLTRLRLHIQEVSQYSLASKTRKGEVSAVTPEYMQSLQAEERRLTPAVEGRSLVRNLARFARD